jgi:hypothetical protein
VFSEDGTKTQLTDPVTGPDEQCSIDISDLSDGHCFLRLVRADGTGIRKTLRDEKETY